MKRKLFLVTGILLALAITGVSYAASTQATNTVSISSSGFADVYQATDASATTPYVGKYGTVGFSSWQPAKNVSGTTGTGDLYVIEPATGYSGDIYGTLYLNNAAKLSNDYSYLNLNISIYGYDGTGWTNISGTADVLTLVNGYVNFTIPGSTTYTKYSISVDGGSYYCISTNASNGTLSPSYYVEIK